MFGMPLLNVSNEADHELLTHPTLSDFNLLLQEEGADQEVTIPSPYDLNNLNCSYWSTESLFQNCSSNRSNLFVHFNIQCLATKYDNLVTFLKRLSSSDFEYLPTALALSETWLSEANEDSFPISGYHPIVSNIRKDNSGRGGVALYVREDHHVIPRPDLDIFVPFLFESVFVTLKDINLTIGVIYRSPSADTAAFLQTYQQLFHTLNHEQEKIVLLGDFNIDLLDYHDDANVAEFVDSTFEFGFIPSITIPTRVTPTSASCIDNIISDASLHDSVFGVLIEDVSDHFPIFCQFSKLPSTFKQNMPPQPNHTFRNYSDSNILKLTEKLSSYDWYEITTDNNPSSAANKLTDILTSLLDQTCPLKTSLNRKKNIPNQPWFTKGLKISSKRKLKLFKKAKTNQRRMSFYRKYRNIYNKLIKQAKAIYYSKALRDASTNIKKTWDLLKEIISKKKNICSVPNILNVSKTDSFILQLDNPNLIAEYFNSFFASVGERTSNLIDSIDQCDPLDFMNDIHVEHSFFLTPTDPTEIIATALRIKSKSSTGFDNISNNLTKKIIPYIAIPLAHIFNSSFSTGIFPDSYKIAKVIPI